MKTNEALLMVSCLAIISVCSASPTNRPNATITAGDDSKPSWFIVDKDWFYAKLEENMQKATEIGSDLSGKLKSFIGEENIQSAKKKAGQLAVYASGYYNQAKDSVSPQAHNVLQAVIERFPLSTLPMRRPTEVEEGPPEP